MNRARVSQAAKLQQALAEFDATAVQIGHGVKRQNRREFFGGERKRTAHLRRLEPRAMSTRVDGWHSGCRPWAFRNCSRGAADHLRIRRARSRQKNESGNRLGFLGGKKMRALPAALIEHCFAHRFFDHDGLLRRTDGAVVKRLSRRKCPPIGLLRTSAVRSINAGTFPGPTP